MVKCVKLGKELPGMAYKPIDGELGQKVYDSVSGEAWKMWLEHSKMIINEYRLDLISPKAREVLTAEMDKYFFGEGATLPPDYKPAPAK
jgi:Fe-S cluster biosynthesis and repair protein YggX